MISKNLKDFNLRQIADSGQCFRMIPCAPNDPHSGIIILILGRIMVLISALLTLRMNIFQKRRLSAVEYGS